jgi:hypothetical protein
MLRSPVTSTSAGRLRPWANARPLVRVPEEIEAAHPINRSQAELLAERAGQVLDRSAEAGEAGVLPFPLPRTDSPNTIDLRD